MIVYVVTSGEYSSYHIDQVFTDRKQAELFCATHNDAKDQYDDPCKIEEYETDKVRLEGNVYYGICGTVCKEGNYVLKEYVDIVYSSKPIQERIEDEGGDYVLVYVPTAEVYKDLNIAEKVVYDYLAKHKAEQEGI